ncbi:hypothetical protein [Candidatus Laterigemmans baculatus]|uniref:hypothetical protein n=1 Tax=Candidatus Laterigemmans baculatus TaxID=2770505 RepID=UPI0013DCD0CE|nr:hypothetical protein [Candidatus Laterigemmans baculatus]
MRNRLGICQWFHYQDYASVERAVELLHDLNVRHLRTGVSWADFHRPGGAEWYEWQMRQLADFEVLLSVWHTPPSLAEGRCCSGPPRRLADYADFIGQLTRDYGDFFSHLELWNEPNNRYKWGFDRFDPEWAKFAEMIRLAAAKAQQDGVPTVLGGMCPADPQWIALMDRHQALHNLDIIAIHAFPEMWWDDQPNWEWYTHWRGWKHKIEKVAAEAGERPIWVTETGLATWDLEAHREDRYELQVVKLREAALAPAERVYWYSLIDLDPAREAIEGFHVDENEYHMGLVSWEGVKKPAYDVMKELLAEKRSRSSRCAAAAPS